MEPWSAVERLDCNSLAAKIVSPDSRFIQTAHRHRHVAPQPLNDLDHQPLGTAGVQAEHDLENARLG
jgi:hypothetical protein